METVDVLKGRLGGADGYDVRCTLDDDQIIGRVGGKLAGKEIRLEITETGVSGSAAGLEVFVELKDGKLVGKVGPRGTHPARGRQGVGSPGRSHHGL